GVDGRFTILNVPTTLGVLNVIARVVINGRTFIAFARLQSVSGGQTDAGILTVRLLGMPIPRFSAGDSHTVALRTDGTLWAWGANNSGQLGIGTFKNTNRPQPIQTNISWRTVATGYQHSLGVRADGSLWAWGDNTYGQLGNGSLTKTNTPQPIQSNATWQ